MKIETAIVAAGAMIAAAIMVTHHWQIAPGLHYAVNRLDRWTGKIVNCDMRRDSAGKLALFVGDTDQRCD